MKHKRNLGIILGVAIIVLVMCIIASSYNIEDSYVGEFITANKIYLNDGSLNIVIYFNTTPDTHYLIFEDWDARHSVQLSNLVEGDRIKVHYRDYTFGTRKIVEIDMFE